MQMMHRRRIPFGVINGNGITFPANGKEYSNRVVPTTNFKQQLEIVEKKTKGADKNESIFVFSCDCHNHIMTFLNF